MKILVIGSGGREHAICWTLRKTSTEALELFCAPGNAGIAQRAKCLSISANDNEALAAFAQQNKIDLTMVGPEAPLAEGIVDLFNARGLKIAGPSREAARLESSKAFAKDFMSRHSIPTARYDVAVSAEEATAILITGKFGDERSPVVIKADGLAAGKGVFVARNRREAFDALNEIKSGVLGTEAAKKIVIEEALDGREVSLLLFSDGKDFRLMPAARDHKRVGEGDTGPNTGGMGSITDASILEEETLARIVREVVQPTLKGCAAERFPFRGILFIGLMLTIDGPRVLEYNVRFGDPETQAILVRLQSDLANILQAITETRLGEIEISWSKDSSACVVLASRGYPAKAESAALIKGLDAAKLHPHVTIFHAATSRDENGEWLTAGGRVLGVTATGEALNDALARCYAAVTDISWDGMHYRRDIGRSIAAAGST
ncbi:MAG: phosphoribosylamine--glycine ligase [Acidobacteria bacterium]|nr:MAG: phosphoribosylamine--glycine ligase [Acidobacteriota bacterium]